MSDTIDVRGRGARGESFADVARRTGAFDAVAGDTDAQVMAKVDNELTENAQAILDQATVLVEQASDLVEPANVFVAADLATAVSNGEAAVAEGTYFKVVGTAESEAQIRIRTAVGSDIITEELTKAALQSNDSAKGANLIMHRRSDDGTYARTLRQWEVIGGYNSLMHWVPPDLDEDIMAGVYDEDILTYLNTGIEHERKPVLPQGKFYLSGSLILLDNTLLSGVPGFLTELFLIDGANAHLVVNERNLSVIEATSSAIRNSNIHIRHLLLNGNRANQDVLQRQAIDLCFIDFSSMQYVKAVDTAGHGFNLCSARNCSIVDWLADNFGDDGVSVSDAFTDYSYRSEDNYIGRGVPSNANNVPIAEGGYNTFGAGVEVDDGAKRTTIEDVCPINCKMSFYFDTSTSAAAASGTTGDITWNRCHSFDPVVGHWGGVGRYDQEHYNFALNDCSANGQPTTPNSVSGALSFSNGPFFGVRVQGFKNNNGGRINLRGCEDSEFDIIHDSPDRIDVRGDALTGIDTKIRNTKIHIVAKQGTIGLFRDLVSAEISLYANAMQYVHAQIGEDSQFRGFAFKDFTDTSYSLRLGGATSLLNSVSFIDGVIEGGAGHAVYYDPGADARSLVGINLERVRIARNQKQAMRFITGAGGGIIDPSVVNCEIVDNCLNASGSVHQIAFGSDANTIVDNFRAIGSKVRLSGDETSAATHGIWVRPSTTGLTNLFWSDGDIRDSGSTANVSDTDGKFSFRDTLGSP